VADDETKPKRKAKDNSWYRLVTLHGEPSGLGEIVIVTKNRKTWNRWMASKMPNDQRASLLETGQYTIEELTPFPKEELRSIGSQVGVETSAEGFIDFSDTEFDLPFFA
jgi:hypothetical protein